MQSVPLRLLTRGVVIGKCGSRSKLVSPFIIHGPPTIIGNSIRKNDFSAVEPSSPLACAALSLPLALSLVLALLELALLPLALSLVLPL